MNMKILLLLNRHHTYLIIVQWIFLVEQPKRQLHHGPYLMWIQRLTCQGIHHILLEVERIEIKWNFGVCAPMWMRVHILYIDHGVLECSIRCTTFYLEGHLKSGLCVCVTFQFSFFCSSIWFVSGTLHYNLRACDHSHVKTSHWWKMSWPSHFTLHNNLRV